jgi:hypothetical protein
MSELLDYDKAIVELLKHIEDRIERFALQNYAASGAVLLAHFGTTNRVPLPVAKWTVIALGLVFTVAIISNAARYHVLWKLHRIARDCWLGRAEQANFRDECKKDAGVESYLDTKKLPLLESYGPLIAINLLPAVAVSIWGFADAPPCGD